MHRASGSTSPYLSLNGWLTGRYDGPGSARSQAVPCVKTCSSLSALQEERLKIRKRKSGFCVHSGSEKQPGICLRMSLTSHTILIVRVREGITNNTVIQLKLMRKNKVFRYIHLMSAWVLTVPARSQEHSEPPPTQLLTFPQIPPRRYRIISAGSVPKRSRWPPPAASSSGEKKSRTGPWSQQMEGK